MFGCLHVCLDILTLQKYVFLGFVVLGSLSVGNPTTTADSFVDKFPRHTEEEEIRTQHTEDNLPTSFCLTWSYVKPIAAMQSHGIVSFQEGLTGCTNKQRAVCPVSCTRCILKHEPTKHPRRELTSECFSALQSSVITPRFVPKRRQPAPPPASYQHIAFTTYILYMCFARRVQLLLFTRCPGCQTNRLDGGQNGTNHFLITRSRFLNTPKHSGYVCMQANLNVGLFSSSEMCM